MFNALSDFFLSIGVPPVVGGFFLGVGFCLLLMAIKRAMRFDSRNSPSDELARFRDPAAFSGGSIAAKPKVHYRINGEVKALPDEIADQVMAALKEAKKIEAVKIVKDATGLGLKDAKDIVDHWGESVVR